MRLLQNKNVYWCVPIAFGLPIIFFALTILSIFMILWLIQIGQSDVAPIFYFFACSSFSIAVVTLAKAIWRIEIQQDVIVCKGILPQNTFSLEYEKCTVGIDWHKQNGEKVWWIYLCYGFKPAYATKNPTQRMNTLKCRPNFIRIMYREEVYQALLSVLPKKQRTSLETSYRRAKINTQGNII